MSSLSISIVIPTYLRHIDLHRCLIAIEQQKRIPDELILVIGPNDKISLNIFSVFSKRQKNWKIINASHQSVIQSLNSGIQFSCGDIVAFTDDDSAPCPDWLNMIENYFVNFPDVGAVGGRDRIIYKDMPHLFNPTPKRIVGRFNWHGMLIGNHHCGAVNSPSYVDVLKGVNFSYRRNAIQNKLIDPYLSGYGAEVGWEIDLCLAIRKSGYRIIYDNDIYVDHYPGSRICGDDRAEKENIHALKRIQNVAYLDSKYQSIFSMTLVFLRSTIFGSRQQPGLLRGIFLYMIGQPRVFSLSLKVFHSYFKGFSDGLRHRLIRFFEFVK